MELSFPGVPVRTPSGSSTRSPRSVRAVDRLTRKNVWPMAAVQLLACSVAWGASACTMSRWKGCHVASPASSNRCPPSMKSGPGPWKTPPTTASTVKGKTSNLNAAVVRRELAEQVELIRPWLEKAHGDFRCQRGALRQVVVVRAQSDCKTRDHQRVRFLNLDLGILCDATPPAQLEQADEAERRFANRHRAPPLVRGLGFGICVRLLGLAERVWRSESEREEVFADGK